MDNGQLRVVGDRKEGTGGKSSKEYLYVPPGSGAVVAPMDQGEEPTIHHAVVAILSQLMQQHPAVTGAKKKLMGLAGGGIPGLDDLAVDTGGGMDPNVLAQFLAKMADIQSSNSQFNAGNLEKGRQFNQGQGQNMEQFNRQAQQRSYEFNAGMSQHNQDREDARANQQLEREAAMRQANAGGGNQYSNALQIAREGNANALEIARMQNETARSGQANQFALGQASNKLNARQQLSERSTRQLVGPGSGAFPTLGTV